MAARSITEKDTVFVDSERRRFRSIDPETALLHQIQIAHERHGVELLVVCDLDGAPVAAAGDEERSFALAAFAAATAKNAPERQVIVTNQGFVIVDVVDARGRTFVVAAQGRFAIPDVSGVSRAVAGAKRILQDGLTIGDAAPIPLVAYGGWGDWSAI